MIVKLLDSFAVCVDITVKRHRNILLKSHLMSSKRQFCSNKDQKGTPDEVDVKKLLNSSSPLRSSRKSDNMWATSPYPEGTVFRALESEADKDPTPSEFLNSDRTVILFPGQGNQFVGMAKNLLKYRVASDMFRAANEILGYDLLKICLEGPEHLLNDTKHCQPATFVCSLGLLEKLKDERPWVISNCVATCGYSLGELTALVFAGCVSFEKGLRLVKKRCEAMQECCKNVPGGMLTVLTGPRTTLSTACQDAIEHCKSNGINDPVCAVASYLFPNCKVVAGNEKALEFLEKNAAKYFIRRLSRLPVAGAFHTELMKDAAEVFKEELENIELRSPLVRLFSNVTANPYRNVKNILRVLPQQIYRPVKWEQIMQNVLKVPDHFGLPNLYECGPGNSLTVVAKKVNNKANVISCSLN